jgi:hypothetical protein
VAPPHWAMCHLAIGPSHVTACTMSACTVIVRLPRVICMDCHVIVWTAMCQFVLSMSSPHQTLPRVICTTLPCHRIRPCHVSSISLPIIICTATSPSHVIHVSCHVMYHFHIIFVLPCVTSIQCHVSPLYSAMCHFCTGPITP